MKSFQRLHRLAANYYSFGEIVSIEGIAGGFSNLNFQHNSAVGVFDLSLALIYFSGRWEKRSGRP